MFIDQQRGVYIKINSVCGSANNVYIKVNKYAYKVIHVLYTACNIYYISGSYINMFYIR